MELKEKIAKTLCLELDGYDWETLDDIEGESIKRSWLEIAAKILEQVEAGYISKDRVREKLSNLKAEQKRRYKTGSMNWLLVERKIEMLEELLGES